MARLLLWPTTGQGCRTWFGGVDIGPTFIVAVTLVVKSLCEEMKPVRFMTASFLPGQDRFSERPAVLNQFRLALQKLRVGCGHPAEVLRDMLEPPLSPRSQKAMPVRPWLARGHSTFREELLAERGE